MQTFMPYPSFEDSLKALDYRRLGKQRIEARMALDNLLGIKQKKWGNHIVNKIWKGYEEALTVYYNCCLSEWESRGYKNNMPYYAQVGEFKYPWWLGNIKLHVSHRINLLNKDFIFYREAFNVQDADQMFISSFPFGYWWPIDTQGKGNKRVKKVWENHAEDLVERYFPDLKPYIYITMGDELWKL